MERERMAQESRSLQRRRQRGTIHGREREMRGVQCVSVVRRGESYGNKTTAACGGV